MLAVCLVCYDVGSWLASFESSLAAALPSRNISDALVSITSVAVYCLSLLQQVFLTVSTCKMAKGASTGQASSIVARGGRNASGAPLGGGQLRRRPGEPGHQPRPAAMATLLRASGTRTTSFVLNKLDRPQTCSPVSRSRR